MGQMRDKDPEPGDTAELVGLSRTDLNGRRVEVQARATGKDGTPRFVVQVLGADGGGPVKVKAKNLKLDCGADPALDTLVEALTLATGAAPTASGGELGAASDSPPAAQTRDWIATFPKGPRSYSRPPLPWPADAEFDARNPPNTPYGRKVNTSGVYAALSNGKVKKMTRSIFNKWGDLHAMTFIEKSPYEGLTQDNMGESSFIIAISLNWERLTPSGAGSHGQHGGADP